MVGIRTQVLVPSAYMLSTTQPSPSKLKTVKIKSVPLSSRSSSVDSIYHLSNYWDTAAAHWTCVASIMSSLVNLVEQLFPSHLHMGSITSSGGIVSSLWEGMRRLSAKYYPIYIRTVHLQIWYPQGSSLPQMLMDSRRTVHAYFRILEHVRRITDNFHFRIWCWPTLSDTSI